MPVGDDSMHEKTKEEAKGVALDCGCSGGGGQQTGRFTWICSVGACVTARTRARVGHRRATPGAHAAPQAGGLGSKRAGRRGSGVGINIRWSPLDASRSGESTL